VVETVISVIVQHVEPRVAADMARELYQHLSECGRHVILDTPGDFRTNLPERRLSAAQVLVLAQQDTTTTTPKS